MQLTVKTKFFFFVTLAVTIFFSNFINIQLVSAATWTELTSSGSRGWRSISVSDDGSVVGAAVDGGYLYTSSDSGENWLERTGAGLRNWKAIALSEDGSVMSAVAYSFSYVHTSADYGSTWTSRLSSDFRNWYGTSLSADGTKMAAAAFSGYIYTTENSGTTWSTKSNSSGSRNWYAVTSSDSGSKLAAVVNGGYLYTSSDSAVTWVEKTSLGSKAWYMISSSGDGSKIAAVVDNGYIYTSSDSGENWTEHTTFGNKSWRSISVSDDGSSIAAVVNGGYIYTSSDFGDTWVTQTDLGTKQWSAVALTANGGQVFAATSNSYIYKGVFDATAPTITSVSSDKTNGTYADGEIIDIDVTFSEDVTSTGSVTITLETGDTDRTCTFTVSDSNTGTCNYTVQTGDAASDLNILSISGAIEDGASNAMTDFEPATDLASNKSIVIDTTAPIISSPLPEDVQVGGTTSVILEVTTNENATCKFGLISETSFDSILETFENTGGTTHTQEIFELSDETTYLYYVRCSDGLNYNNSDTQINFYIPKLPSNGSGGMYIDIDAKCFVSDTKIETGESVEIQVEVKEVSKLGEALEYDFKWVRELSGKKLKTSHIFNEAGVYIPKAKIATSFRDKIISCEPIKVLELESKNEEIESLDSIPENTESNNQTFTKDLFFTMNDPEVKMLQEFLNSNGYIVSGSGPGSVGNETTFFGYATKMALIKFQNAAQISPTIGYFGPVTRELVNLLIN